MGANLLSECAWKSELDESNGEEIRCSSPKEIEVHDVYHLPIIKAHADGIDLVNTIKRLVSTRIEIEPETLVLALTLSRDLIHPPRC
jgi:hypothetical protein